MVALRGAPPSAAQRELHDRHRPWIVAPVLAALLVYCWCYTHLLTWLGVPAPGDVAGALGWALPRVIDADGNIDSKLVVTRTALFANDEERLVVFAALFGAFVSTYFAPLRHKLAAIVGWFLLGFGVLYGVQTTATLLAGHLGIYLLFHPGNRWAPWIAGGLGGLVGVACGGGVWLAAIGVVALVFRGLRGWLVAGGRAVAALRIVAIQACMITIAVAAVREGVTGQSWQLPVGVLVLFYQWARLMVYHADFRDGEVPAALGVWDYLGVFLSPAGLTNFAVAPYLGQGYSYLAERHLARDKTALVVSGLRLWGLALVYMVFAEQAMVWFAAAVERLFGVPVYRFTSELVRAHLAGVQHSQATVLVSTIVDQARIFLIYGGITHFRVGAWRVLGYQVDTQYDRPWLATNLANLWGRFAFHFREFLVRVFYYPVFLRCFRRRRLLRIGFATLVATVVGNLVWGHVPPKLLGELRWQVLVTILSTWPYFVLLGLGIALTQVWLMWRPRTRRPWTLDRRLALDVVCAYLTLQYFALIHVFIRPQPGGTLADLARLVAIGLGLR